MIERLKSLFAGEVRSRGPDELRLAAAALLAEAARQDGAIEPREHAAIKRVLATRFGLTAAEAEQLARAGEAAAEDATQLFAFTRVINRDLPPEERITLFEMIYEVIYADDVLNAREDSLMRRLGALIYVPDKERGAARLRVLRRLGRAD